MSNYPANPSESLENRLRFALDAACEIDELMAVQLRMLHTQSEGFDMALQGFAVRCQTLTSLLISVCGNDVGTSVEDLRSLLFGSRYASEITRESST